MPRIAIVTTVLNETRWLRLFLRWHKAAGVEHFYFYLDGDSPAVRGVLGDEDSVDIRVIERDQTAEHHALFQMRCMNDALHRARHEGYDWLLMIDPDEFAWGSIPAQSDRFSLSAMLDTVPDTVEEVRLTTLEAQPVQSWITQPFWQALYVIHDRAVERDILDPMTGSMRQLNRWMGHKLGKGLIRVESDVHAFNPHSWTKDSTRPVPALVAPVQQVAGCHLHIPVLHGRQWRQKYAVFRHHFIYPRGQAMEFPKWSWSQAALKMSAAECCEYFKNWLALTQSQIDTAVWAGILSRAEIFEGKMEDLNAEELMNDDDLKTS